jgi:hypothetical protein
MDPMQLLNKITRTIYVTFQKEGIHAYPEAPEEVSFLRSPHRHMFHFKVWMSVEHNERDVEFIMLKRELESLYDQDVSVNMIDKSLKLNNLSCESMAEELLFYVTQQYPGRLVMVEVSEDGENGAILQSIPVMQK